MSAVLWIGGLPRDTSEDEVEEFLRDHGKLEDIQIRSSVRDTFAFVTFQDKKDAIKAIKDFDGQSFLDSDSEVRLEISTKGNKVNSSTKRASSPRRLPSPRRSRSPRRSTRDRPSRDRRERSSSASSGNDESLTVWMGGLPQGVREEEIEDFCRGFGKINSIHIRSSERDVFAFVNFADAELGQKACTELDQVQWKRNDDHKIQVRESKTKRPTRDKQRYRRDRRERSSSASSGNDKSLTAWMGGLPKGVREEEIEDFCRGFGKISSVRIRSSERDVFAFVIFADAELGQKACTELDQVQWKPNDDHIIQVRESKTKRPTRDKHRYRTPSIHRNRTADAHRLEIHNLPPDMTWSELKDMARWFGDSVSFTNVFTRSGVTCGVVDYRSRSDADNAYKKMHRKRVHGHDKRLEITRL